MATFASADEVYDQLGRVFRELVADEELGPQVQGADTVLQLRLTDPEATITVSAKAGQERAVDTGETQHEPEVVLAMAADVAHQFFLGELNLTIALARGEILAKGPVRKILEVVPVVRPIFPRYKAQLEGAAA
ncbi:MAG TPA: SCP2 sterol-binding domain-containing protein [Baekduia sp.]|nr:SCP2 sterol-binding domain-containing protein [Baekduia sp.]